MSRFRVACLLLSLFADVGLSACAPTPPRPQAALTVPCPDPVLHREVSLEPVDSAARKTVNKPGPLALAVARGHLRTPYVYGGRTPRGFDCSGLVWYSYRQAGVTVPRTSLEQYRQSRPVSVAELSPGDLVFFRVSRQKVSHVGLYVADGRFIHAPSSGKGVCYDSLDSPYWEQRLVAGGRLP